MSKSEAIQSISFLPQNNLGVVVMLTGCPTMVVKVAGKPPVNQRGQGNKMLETRSSQISSLMSPSNNQGSKSFWDLDLEDEFGSQGVWTEASCFRVLCLVRPHFNISNLRCVPRHHQSCSASLIGWWGLSVANDFPFQSWPPQKNSQCQWLAPHLHPKKTTRFPKHQPKKETSIVWALPKHCISG